MFDIAHQIQAPARIKALSISFGIATTPSQAARARTLASSVHAIRPGIYAAGKCQVNLWRMSCTCKTHRARALAGQPFKPCDHFLALYLAGEWSPMQDPPAYFASAGMEEPAVIAIYCRVKLPAFFPPAPLGFEVLEASQGWATLLNLATGTHASAPVSALNHIVTLYQ